MNRYGFALRLGGLAVILLAVACSASPTPIPAAPAAPAARPAPRPPEVATVSPTAIAASQPTPAATESPRTSGSAEDAAAGGESLFSWDFQEVDSGTKPAIALSSDDVPHIAYMLEDLNGFVKSATRTDSGWQPETIAEGYFYGPLDIGIGPDDVQQVAYHDHQGATFQPNKGDAVLAKKSNGKWTLEAIFDAGHDGWDTRIFVDSDSRAHLSAIDPMEFGGDGVEYYSQDETGAWTVENVGSGELTYKWATSVAVGPDGVPYVTYYDQKNNDLVLASKIDGAWQLETVDSAGDTGLFSSVLVDEQGGVHISYMKQESASSGTVMYAVKGPSDDAWKIDEIGGLDSLEFGFIGARNVTSLSLDGAGNPWIAYTDEKVVKLALWDGSQWQIEIVLDAGKDKLGQLVSLKLDSKDEPHITYFVVTSSRPLGGNIMYAKGVKK